jgi:hypothetical protein
MSHVFFSLMISRLFSAQSDLQKKIEELSHLKKNKGITTFIGAEVL